ncbi:MAG: heme-binding protein [Proteobacteria bacterium]|nr:heme-binding protein [Pseudomonadota bacterium]MDA1330966.1 heme-binding protein [Pseudomonadota bacterium]
MTSISLDHAQKCLDVAIKKVQQDFKRPICVSICDSYGYQVAFYRMDKAPIRSIAISQQKAHTATRMGMSTDAFLERLNNDKIDIQYFCDPLMTALPGGNLLKSKGGEILGAVGVSGLKPVEDQIITETVADWFLEQDN